MRKMLPVLASVLLVFGLIAGPWFHSCRHIGPNSGAAGPQHFVCQPVGPNSGAR